MADKHSSQLPAGLASEYKLAKFLTVEDSPQLCCGELQLINQHVVLSESIRQRFTN